jgi:4-hydroxybenzoate polyprenyltransferase
MEDPSDGGGQVPLYVDLDGTLVATDLLWEGVVLLARRSPWRLLRTAFTTLPRGRAAFKHEIARVAVLDVATLPYREDTVTRVRAARASGRPVVLATAADGLNAERVARHLGAFTDVLASDGTTNLRGRTKLAAVQAHAGGPFDYIGDGPADVPVIGAARNGESLSTTHGGVGALVRGLRPHQWTKNLLVLAPTFLAHEYLNTAVMSRALVGAAAFCAAASGAYLFNDLLDLEADRAHPTKRYRPLAAGTLPLAHGAVAGLILLGVGLGLGVLLGPAFAALLLAYIVTAQAYSIVLKGLPVLDVLTLSALYSLRIFAGGIAADVPVSAWLLAFSSFLFLSLAFVKRYEELLSPRAMLHGGAKGRGYQSEDVELVRAFGPAAGYISVLVLALYVYSDQVRSLYHRPAMLWLVAPLMLYWITRLWFLAHRGRLGSDPVIFAVRDPVSYLIGFTTILIVLAAGPT